MHDDAKIERHLIACDKNNAPSNKIPRVLPGILIIQNLLYLYSCIINKIILERGIKCLR